MFKLLRKFRRNQSGATAIEYALIAAVIGVGILTAAQTLGTNISTKLTGVGTSLTNAGPAAPAAGG